MVEGPSAERLFGGADPAMALARATDWAATPLGPVAGWPPELCAAIRTVLPSRIPMLLWWGPELVQVYNEAYSHLLGSKHPAAMGQPAAECWAEIWDEVGPMAASVLDGGGATFSEELLLFMERHGYREETYWTFSYSPVEDAGGRVTGVFVATTDTTAQVLTERRLGTLRELGTVSAAQPRTGGEPVAEAYRAAVEVLGREPMDVPFALAYDAGGGLAAVAGATGDVPEEMRRDLREAALRAVESGRAETVSGAAVALPLPAGALVLGVSPYRELDGEYRLFLDIAAAQVSVTVADALAYQAERRRAEALAELDAAKTRFFQNVSHEFRTPLTLLLGPLGELLADTEEPLGERQRDRLTVVQRNGLRLLKLVNTLLDFSRIESGRLAAEFEPTDLAAYTRELASMFETAAARLGLTLEVDCPPLPREVHVDRDLWGKVVLNLLSNALKFTLEGGVTVGVAADGDEAVVTVRDTGTGIPAAEQPQLFERFHRVSGARSRTHEGSGIGLALVGELVQLHGGRVGVTSEVSGGSCFEVRLPFGSAHLPAEQVVASAGRGLAPQVVETFLAEATQFLDEPGQPSATAPATEERPRVLVVDDNPDIRHYVAGLLSEHFDVETAVDGQDGLDRARAGSPDLVLTDVMMPRLTGFELLSALRSSPETVGIPVVMLSARGGEEGTLEGLEAGADDYLVKPFTARELVARVRANLELDRARRIREHLERNTRLLRQAQRLARVSSWEVDLVTGSVQVSEEFGRILGRSLQEIEERGFPGVVEEYVHPDDQALVLSALAGAGEGSDVRYEVRVLRPDGSEVVVGVHAEVVTGENGQPTMIRGSLQDVTERRRAAEALALAQAASEVAAREHAIADELQRSLLPEHAFDLAHLEVATYYRAGVEGTQVGGDWYDVIELADGCTALVVGDVMGRGVRAAAVMGQIRATLRAYARLGLPPASLMGLLDAMVRDLAPDQIVTCLYAVFDPETLVLSFVNAGHLPPLVTYADGSSARVGGEAHPPLGVGQPFTDSVEVPLLPGARVVLYTDGLVERRGEDLETGINALLHLVSALDVPLDAMPETVARALLPDGLDDDVAVLVAEVPAGVSLPAGVDQTLR